MPFFDSLDSSPRRQSAFFPAALTFAEEHLFSCWPAVTSSVEVEPSGIAPHATMLPLPPPKQRQPRPRSEIFVVPAVSESISPDTGADGGVVSPALPQLAVPGETVNVSVAAWAFIATPTIANAAA